MNLPYAFLAIFIAPVCGSIVTDPEVEQWEHGDVRLRCDTSDQVSILAWSVIDETSPPGFVTKALLENGNSTSFDKRFSVDMKGTMLMTNLTLLDGGRYVCQVTTADDAVYKSFTNVTVKPYVITDPTAIGWKGETVKLPCNFSGYHVHASWTKATDYYEYASYDYGSQSFQEDRIRTDEEYSLIIEDLEVIDEGTYICRVERENDIVVDSSTSLFVNSMVGEHKIDQCTHNGSCEFEVTRGAIFILDCRVTGFKPNITLHWMLSGEVMTPLSDDSSPMDDGTNERMLSIEVDSETGIGQEFTCMASGDTVLSGNSTVTVTVREASRFNTFGTSFIFVFFFFMMGGITYLQLRWKERGERRFSVFGYIAIATQIGYYITMIAFLVVYFTTATPEATLLVLYLTCTLFLTRYINMRFFPLYAGEMNVWQERLSIPWFCTMGVLIVLLPLLFGVGVIQIPRDSIYAMSNFIFLAVMSLYWTMSEMVGLVLLWKHKGEKNIGVFAKIETIAVLGSFISLIVYLSLYFTTNQPEAILVFVYLTCSLLLTSFITDTFFAWYTEDMGVWQKRFSIPCFCLIGVLNVPVPLLIGVGVIPAQLLTIYAMTDFITLFLPISFILKARIVFLFKDWKERGEKRLSVFRKIDALATIGCFISLIMYMIFYLATDQPEATLVCVYLIYSLFATGRSAWMFPEYAGMMGPVEKGFGVIWFCTFGILNVVVPILIGVGVIKDFTVAYFVVIGIFIATTVLRILRANKTISWFNWELQREYRTDIRGYEIGKAARIQLPSNTTIIINVLGPVGSGKSAFIKSLKFAYKGEYPTLTDERSDNDTRHEEIEGSLSQLTQNIKIREINGAEDFDASHVTNIYPESFSPHDGPIETTRESRADDEEVPILRTESRRTLNYPVFVHEYKSLDEATKTVNSFCSLAEKMHKIYERYPMLVFTHDETFRAEGQWEDYVWSFENYTSAEQNLDGAKNVKLLKFIWRLLKECDYIIDHEVNGKTDTVDDDKCPNSRDEEQTKV